MSKGCPLSSRHRVVWSSAVKGALHRMNFVVVPIITALLTCCVSVPEGSNFAREDARAYRTDVFELLEPR
jgi:hypothetical protein